MDLEGGSKLSRPPGESWLAVECEVIDAVLLPALFVVLGAEGFFFAVTDGSDAFGGNSLLDQRLLCRFGAAGAESDVVLFRAAIVAMAFDEHFDAGMLDQEGFVILHDGRIVRTQIGPVVVEENISDVPGEQILV